MKIVSAKIKNYGSFYGSHDFQFADRGLVLVLGDNKDDPRQNSNGGGKSTVFEAVDWCLFGDVPRGDSVDSIINDEVGKDCSVGVSLVEGTTEIIIIRWRKLDGKDSGVSITVNGKETTALDSSETDKKIVEVLGLDREVFHALVFFQQGDRFNFATATDKERVDILTKVLQLDAVDHWLDQFKAKEQSITQQIAAKESERASLKGQLEALDAMNHGGAGKIQAWDMNHAEAVRQQMIVIAEAEKALNAAGEAAQQHNLDALAQAVEAAKAATPQADPAVRQKYADDKKMANEKISKIHMDIGAASAVDKRCRDTIVQHQARGNTNCSSCGQMISPQHVEQHLASVREELTKAQATIEAATAASFQWVEWRNGVETAEQHYANQIAEAQKEHIRATAEAMTRLSHARASQATFQNARLNYENAVRQVDVMRAQVNPHIAEQAGLIQKCADLAQSIHYLEEHDLKGLREALQYTQFWTVACGPKGVKSYILDSRVRELDEAINHWLKLLFGGTHWLRIETQTMAKTTGKLSNKLNLRVFRHNPDGTISERSFKSWSGGEQRRIGLAIDMGLSRLVAARAHKRYDLLILDEVFEHLDSAGRDAVVDTLHQLQAEKGSIFVIDHDAEFQGAFATRVTVTKHNRRSTIVTEELKHEQAQTLPQQDAQGPVAEGGNAQGSAEVSSEAPVGAGEAAVRKKRRKRSAASSVH